ncbi:hypothetical protein ABW20_dc0103419 [Dactylellina cionopaga]|nr:hypothetical protein ABW20_dc0103419 [Dactylellina cionopaga]
MLYLRSIALGDRRRINRNDTDSSKVYDINQITEDVDIKWHKCSDKESAEMSIRKLTIALDLLKVPLDYKNPGNGLRAIIPIVKYAAAKDVPYKGSVLVNPGGPGGLGTELVYELGTAQMIEANITGRGWDILGFDPRGVGYSVPYASCDLSSPVEPSRQNALSANMPTPRSRKRARRQDNNRSRRYKRSPFSNSTDTETKDVVFGMVIPRTPYEREMATDRANFESSQCVKNTGAYNQAGQYMNTAVVAIDMLSMGKALARERGEPEATARVNFYGISYGTALGQYFASLYPANVGKFLLDGVMDMDQYVSFKRNAVRHVDEAWSRFFPLCFEAGPNRCPFYANGTSDAIRDRFNGITNKLDAMKYDREKHPAAQDVGSALGALKSMLFDSSYNPRTQWQGVAGRLVRIERIIAPENPSDWNWKELEAAMTKNENLPKNGTEPVDPTMPLPAPLDINNESYSQVMCTDSYDIRGQEITEEDEMRCFNTSKIVDYDECKRKIICARWSIRPVLEWYGPIGGTTATPLLFVGNHYDPITPYENAEKGAKLFTGAQMIFADEMGHGIMGTTNSCSFKHIQAYFQDGKLPGEGTRCEMETNIFPEPKKY